MSIRTKTLLIIGSSLFIAIALLYGISQLILLQSFLELERDTITLNVKRALNATLDEIDFLRTTSLDYAQWDDTFNYIQGLDDSYIETNMLDSVFSNYRLNFVVFVNQAGEVIYSEAFDLATAERRPLPESLAAFVARNDAFLQLNSGNGDHSTDGISGIVQLPDISIMLAISPITHSNHLGESKGVLIWGRYLNNQFIEGLAEQTQLTLSLNPASLADTEADLAEVLPVLLTEPIAVRARNSDFIDGYSLLRDIDNEPALILEIVVPRSIYQQGQNSVTYYSIFLFLIALMGGSAVILLLEKGVMSRLAYLNEYVSRIQKEGDLTLRITMSGHDELTNLAINVNAMIETLEAQEKIKLARDNALEAARLKSEILANVSHDARTPLAVIMLRTEMLIKRIYGLMTPKQIEALGTITVHAQQLLDFASNLLEASQIDSGRLRLFIQETEPALLLETVRATLSPLAAAKNLRLETELDDDVPAVLYGDKRRLEQIVNNLVGNAIKFTESGSVTIKIYRYDAAQWAIEVKDTGKGIAPENHKLIFDSFWQVDSSTTRSANSGVGLGLMIVKQITELMGGSITLSSAVETGSTFTVILPIQQSIEGIEYAETAERLDH